MARSKKWLALGGLALLGSLVPPEEAQAAGVTYYPVHCRGGAKTQVALWLNDARHSWKGTRHTSQAGTVGQYLQPGTCAWEDRKLNLLETPTIVIKYTSTEAALMHAQASVLAQCGTNPNCLIELQARNDAAYKVMRVESVKGLIIRSK